MARPGIHLTLLWLLASLATASGHAAEPPRRIVSLTPHLTELLFDMGAGDRIVATDDASDTPPEARPLPHVANYRSINVEALLAQKPDLVVAWRSAQSRMLAPIEQLGIPVFYSEPTDFASLGQEIRALGTRLGLQHSADAQADAYLARLAALKARYGHGEPVRVFYQLWNPPLTSVSGLAWPAQAIALCGGDNLVANAASPYPQVGLEQIIKADPQLILAGSRDEEALAHWQQWPSLTAVKESRLVLINPDELHRFTPRALNAVEQVCLAIAAARTSLP